MGSELRVPIAPTPLAYGLPKRGLDVFVAAFGLLLTSPLAAAIAVAVKAESDGPILFRQTRLGLGGRPFTVFKFRSMRATADEEAHHEHIRRLIEAGAGPREARWAPISDDQRVTGLGRLLRRSHLDELPQLLNVLRGEMSLVGPRPPIPYEVELYEPRHLARLSVQPGLTGLWQVVGWGRLSFEEGVQLDLEYVRRRSLWLDLRILARTVWQILSGRQF